MELKRFRTDEPEDRLCEGVDKNGYKCGSLKSKGTEFCVFHRGLLGGYYAKAKRDKALTEYMREVAEERMPDIVGAAFDALEANQVFFDRNLGEAVETDIPDHAIRLKAHQTIMERLEGKPDQSMNITGQLDHEIHVNDLFLEATDEAAVEILEPEIIKEIESAD
jgi:hypothetical protein